MNVSPTSAVKTTESFKSTDIGDFPKSWDISSLGNLFDLQQGKALSQKARTGISPRPFLRTINVLWGRLDLTSVDQMDFTEDEFRKLSLKKGDLLVCEGGEIGRSAVWNISDEGFCCQNHVHRLRRKTDGIIPEFVMYWLQAGFLHLRIYGGVGNKTTIPNLSGTKLKQLLLPVPSLQEQKAIAAILSKIQDAIEIQEKIIAKLKELKSATMSKLFREGLHGEPLKQTEIGEIPQSWTIANLGEFFDLQQGKALSQKSRTGISPRPFLRTINVLWGRLDLTSVDQMDFTEDEVKKLSLKIGDLLVCEGGEIGRSAVWNLKDEGFCCQNHVHRLRKKTDEIIPEFVMYWLQVGFLHLRIYGGVGNKTTIPNLSGTKLKQLLMPVPPLNEQKTITLAITGIDKQIEINQKKADHLKSIFSAMLHLLMTGHLRVNQKQ